MVCRSGVADGSDAFEPLSVECSGDKWTVDGAPVDGAFRLTCRAPDDAETNYLCEEESPRLERRTPTVWTNTMVNVASPGS